MNAKALLCILIISISAIGSVLYLNAKKSGLINQENIGIVKNSENAIGEFSISSTDRGVKLGNMQMADYIANFTGKSKDDSDFAEYNYLGSTPTEYHSDYTTLYGIVNMYSTKANENIIVLEMDLVLNGVAYDNDFWGNPKYSKINGVRWEVSQYDGATLFDWAPKGTTEASIEKMDVSLSLSELIGSISTSFKLNKVNDYVTSFASANQYNVQVVSDKGVEPPESVSLTALCVYDITSDTEWTWNYTISYSK